MNIEEYKKMYQLEERHWWFVGKREIIFFLLKSTLGIKKKDHQYLLDAGCGTGIILDHLKKYGEAQGVDISPEALKLCKQRGHTHLYQADITHLGLPPERFNLITALDVLEHLDDDRKALAELYRVCKKEGSLVITVPAYNFLWSQHDEFLHHKRRYNRKSLNAVVQKAGFKIKKISYTNMFIFPVVFIVRQVKILLKSNKEPQSDLTKTPSFLNSILIYLYKVEARLLRLMNLPFGVSLLCIATKLEHSPTEQKK